MTDSQGPLAGYRVVEVARFVTGPYAGQMLADLGAEVIKIEDPDGGDPFRAWARGGYAPPFIAFNRSKRSVTVNLRHKDGIDIVRRLVNGADVFIENFRPGVTKRLGIDYDSLRPLNDRLIYTSITGLGPDGPYAERPSYDIVGQGLSGLLSQLVDLDDPKPVGPTFADTLTGLYAAWGTLAALHGRERTGKGQLVETNLLQATMAFMNEPYSAYFASGTPPLAPDRPKMSQVFAFVCSDGLPLAIHLSSPVKFWEGMVRAAGRADMIDDPRFKDAMDRRRNWDDIHAELKPIFATRTRDEWLKRLQAEDVPSAPIYRLDEAAADPQTRHLGMVMETAHPEKGPLKLVGFPARLGDTPMGPVTAPPTLGEHTDAVLAACGYGADDIARLRADGAI